MQSWQYPLRSQLVHQTASAVLRHWWQLVLTVGALLLCCGATEALPTSSCAIKREPTQFSTKQPDHHEIEHEKDTKFN
jgi:hypothetical protein